MSRKRRRRIKTGPDKKAKGGRGGQIVIIILAVVAAGIPFIYGKYIEFGTNSPFDSALNVYSAKCIVDGQKLNVDVIPSARPATLLVNVVGVAVFGFSEVGPKLIQMLMQLAALGLMFYTIHKVYGILPASVSLILAAFYLSYPLFAKYGNVKEQFMTACMIVTGCGVVLRHLNLKWWWLVVSGGAAINAYYFKPTGASVIIAVILYLFAQVVLRRRSLIEFGSDVGAFFVGTVFGLLPLLLFNLWQGQLSRFLNVFPASAVKLLVVLTMPCLAVYFSIRLLQRHNILVSLNQKNRRILGAAVVIIIFAAVGLSAGFFSDKVVEIYKQIAGLISPAGGYVKTSRAVTIFRSQYDEVVRYYSYLVVPLGLALLAIFQRLKKLVVALPLWRKKSTLQDDTKAEQSQKNAAEKAEQFVLLFGIWWILDMIFVWISPRSYVEYFLPLNGSAAMLAAYAVYCCRKNPAGMVWLLGIWLIVDLVLKQVIPMEIFPYVGFRSGGAVAAYWKGFFWKALPFAAAIAIYWFARIKGYTKACGLIIGLILCGMFFWWNTPNLTIFKERFDRLSSKGQSGWEYVSRYIRERSSPDDGLYVWGWMPGIYVQAQRFCPSPRPSYGNMHSDDPRSVRATIRKLVGELQAQPPRYIVDTQNLHFPYYDHPVFDLWPRWSDNKKSGFHLRVRRPQTAAGKKPLSLNEMAKFSELNYAQVERRTYMQLTTPKRIGGPAEDSKARELARRERKRHEEMAPLRNFVMQNYRPAPVDFGSIILFERK